MSIKNVPKRVRKVLEALADKTAGLPVLMASVTAVPGDGSIGVMVRVDIYDEMSNSLLCMTHTFSNQELDYGFDGLVAYAIETKLLPAQRLRKDPP